MHNVHRLVLHSDLCPSTTDLSKNQFFYNAYKIQAWHCFKGTQVWDFDLLDSEDFETLQQELKFNFIIDGFYLRVILTHSETAKAPLEIM